MTKYDVFFGVQTKCLKAKEKLALKNFKDSWYAKVESSELVEVKIHGIEYSFIAIRLTNSDDDWRKTMDSIVPMVAEGEEFFYYVTQFSFVQHVLGDAINQSLSPISDELNRYFARSWELPDIPNFSTSFPNKSKGISMFIGPDTGAFTEDKMVVSNCWESFVLDNPDDCGHQDGELLYELDRVSYWKTFTIVPPGGYTISVEDDKITIDLLLHLGIKIYGLGLIPQKGIISQSFSIVYKLEGKPDLDAPDDKLDLNLEIVSYSSSKPKWKAVHTTFDLAISVVIFLASSGLSSALKTFAPKDIMMMIKLIKYALKVSTFMKKVTAQKGFIDMLKLDQQFKNDFSIPLVHLHKMVVKKMTINNGWTVAGRFDKNATS